MPFRVDEDRVPVEPHALISYRPLYLAKISMPTEWLHS